MVKYLAEFQRECSEYKETKIFLYKPGATWRELEQKFDPCYCYDNLKFYSLGSEITLDT